MSTVAEAISVLFIIIVIATAAFICRRIAQDPVVDPIFLVALHMNMKLLLMFALK
jgi:hypothetical protein